jgi:hypothetical protein
VSEKRLMGRSFLSVFVTGQFVAQQWKRIVIVNPILIPIAILIIVFPVIHIVIVLPIIVIPVAVIIPWPYLPQTGHPFASAILG